MPTDIPFVTVAEVLQYLGQPELSASEATVMAAQVLAVCKAVEDWCQTPIIQREFTEYRAGGVKNLFLRNYPVLSVTSITDPAGNVVEPSYYYVQKTLGKIVHASRFPQPLTPGGQVAEWTIVYRAGWFANMDEVSQPIKLACMKLVAAARENPTTGIQSVGVGNMSISYGNAGGDGAGGFAGLISPDVQMLLQGFRNNPL